MSILHRPGHPTRLSVSSPSSRARECRLNIIQRQLGHVNLGTTSVYLQGIDTEEIIAAVNSWRAPMMPASAGLQSAAARFVSRLSLR
jgi:hypothetical protein